MSNDDDFVGLAVEYKTRRDFFIDCFADEFELESARAVSAGVWAGANVVEAYSKIPAGRVTDKSAIRTKYFSFVPPTSGMFIWVRVPFFLRLTNAD